MERGTRDRNRRSLWAVGALLLLVSGLWAGALLQRGSEEPSLASAGPDRLFAPRAGVAGLAASIAGGSAAAGHMLGGRASQARRLGGAWEDAPDGSDAAAAAPGSIAAQPGGRCAPERPGAPPPTPRRRRALEPLAAEGAGRSLGPPPGAAPYPWAYPA
ncbi:MAG: hypothetical protein HY554_02810, partial [Elusimicrobia bacterium]|nr:hypothetical protein [Elusimicrobiota bacterium]